MVGAPFPFAASVPVPSETRPFYILALEPKTYSPAAVHEYGVGRGGTAGFHAAQLDDFLQSDKPDHMLDNASAEWAGNGIDEARDVRHGRGKRAQRINTCCISTRSVDRGITELLKADTAPLVIAGVEYELPLYRSVSSFSKARRGGVRGAAGRVEGRGTAQARSRGHGTRYWSKESPTLSPCTSNSADLSALRGA